MYSCLLIYIQGIDIACMCQVWWPLIKHGERKEVCLEERRSNLTNYKSMLCALSTAVASGGLPGLTIQIMTVTKHYFRLYNLCFILANFLYTLPGCWFSLHCISLITCLFFVFNFTVVPFWISCFSKNNVFLLKKYVRIFVSSRTVNLLIL